MKRAFKNVKIKWLEDIEEDASISLNLQIALLVLIPYTASADGQSRKLEHLFQGPCLMKKRSSLRNFKFTLTTKVLRNFHDGAARERCGSDIANITAQNQSTIKS